MLAELRMTLEADDPKLGFYQASNMQGVLMGQIDAGYAGVLHEQGIKPYSQTLLGKEQKEWVVKTCTKEAFQEVILPLLDSGFTSFDIEKKGWHVEVKEKRTSTLEKKELLDEFYSGACERHIDLEFVTPASFKSDGKYVIIPELRYIYQSLMNKFSALSENMEMYDDETLAQLTDYSYIGRYRLRSAAFPAEGVRIPSFQGEIGIKIAGTDTMARYIRLLARFGEYSGVGIKTAMGMGALRIKEREENNV